MKIGKIELMGEERTERGVGMYRVNGNQLMMRYAPFLILRSCLY
jgi:hypothetical protein